MKTLFRFIIRFISFAAVFALAGCLSSEESANTSGITDPTGSGGSTNGAPTISGVPSSSVAMGAEYSFTPTASDPDNDPLTFSVEGRPNWLDFSSSDGALTGMPLLADVGTYTGIAVSVSDGNNSSSLPNFSVNVVQNADGTITVSWTAPTQNDDGTALTDLDAYKIYYGTSPGSYSGQVRIDNIGITTYVLDNLTPTTYYLVATAINSGGRESIFSNEIIKLVL